MGARHRVPVVEDEVDAASCTVAERLRLLASVPFFRAVAPAGLAAINGLFHATACQRGDTIFRAGEPAERLYVVAHGKVKLLRRTAAGQDVLLDLLTPGEMFGSLAVLGDREYRNEAEAQTAGCVLSVDAREFAAILEEHPAVARSVLAVVARRLQEAQESISQLSAMPVEARVAAALVKLAGKVGVPHGEGVLIETPLSREDLAAMTGTTTESVSRVMSRFRREGLVTSGRRWIAVADMAGLAALAASGE